MNIHERIDAKEFEVNQAQYLQWPVEESKTGAAIEAWKISRLKESIERRRLERVVFRKALAKEYGVKDHPKEAVLWRLAWEHGHSSGLHDVIYYYEDFLQLITNN